MSKEQFSKSNKKKESQSDEVIYPDLILTGEEEEEESEEAAPEQNRSFLKEHLYPRLIFFGIFFVNFLILSVFFIRFVYYLVKSLIFRFKEKPINQQVAAALVMLVGSFMMTCSAGWGIIQPQKTFARFYTGSTSK